MFCGYKHINNFNMFYIEQGNGIPIVFIHGFPLSGKIWDFQTPVIESNARVIVPDLRGFGQSEFTDTEYSMELFASDIKALLDTMNIKQVVIAGISMGGYIAFAFYRLFPASVKAMILLDTRAGTDSEEGKKSRIDLARRAHNGEIEQIAEEWITKLLAPATIKSKSYVVNKLRNIITSTNPEIIARASLAMMKRQDSTTLLKDISCPVLIITGEHDRLTPIEEARAMAVSIKGARIEVIKDAGHLTCLEAPEQVNNLIMLFLSNFQN